MNNSSRCVGFIQTHVRLIVALALFSLTLSVLVVQQGTIARADFQQPMQRQCASNCTIPVFATDMGFTPMNFNVNGGFKGAGTYILVGNSAFIGMAAQPSTTTVFSIGPGTGNRVQATFSVTASDTNCLATLNPKLQPVFTVVCS